QEPGGILRVLDPWVADRSQVDGIGARKLREHRIGQDLLGSQVPLRPKVIGDEVQPGAARRGNRFEDPDALGDDLGTDAVAGDDGDPKRHRLQHIGCRPEKGFAALADTTYRVLTEEKALTAALDKMRRLRRVRRLSGLTYWAAWGFVGVVCLLLLAGGIAGLASG